MYRRDVTTTIYASYLPQFTAFRHSTCLTNTSAQSVSNMEESGPLAAPVRALVCAVIPGASKLPGNEPPGRETRSATRGWLTDRQTDTETLKLKVISHGNETEARSGAVTPYTEPQRHPSVRDGHMSARSLTGLKISIHLFNISSIIYLSVRLTVYLSVHPSVRLSIQLSVCLYL